MLGSLHEVRPGRTIYIETFFGNPSGQLAPSNLVALLVIGCNCRHQQYDYQVPALLEAGISVVRYDLLGYVVCQVRRQHKATTTIQTSKAAHLQPEAAYLDLVAVYEQFVLSKGWDSAVVVGHSYGGPLVIRLAAEHPKRIAGLVGLGIGYPKSVPRSSASRKWWQASNGPWYLRVPEWLLQILMPVAAAQVIREVYHPNTFRNNPQLVRAEWLAWSQNAPWVVQSLASQILEFFMPWEKFQAQVRAISAPALIIDQESSEPAGQSAPERMAADMQDAQGFAIPESRHQVHQDQPEAVNRLLLDFLRSKVCHVQV